VGASRRALKDRAASAGPLTSDQLGNTETQYVPITSRFFRVGWCVWLGLLAGQLAANDEPQLPPFAQVRQVVNAEFALPNRHPADLISRSEVVRALRAVQRLGWEISDEREILEQTLADGHVLVATLRSPAGQRFMRQVSGRPLMYDRLERVSQASGGAQLLQDLVKLPDGERYAKPRSGGGVPDLVDLLPKDASGRTRRIADHDKPTGHLYTVNDLLAQLAASHRQALEKSTTGH
jgi:hypothetical protein